MTFVDLHTHILPGVDDGAADLAEAIEIGRRAAADGCSALVATPHLRHCLWWNEDIEGLRRHCEILRAELEGTLELHFGAEITVRHDSLDELFEMPGGALPTLAGSSYVLLEFEPHPSGPDVFEVVHEVRLLGLTPILAHPERIPWMTRGGELLERLVAAGAVLQLTAASLTGAFGRRLKKLSLDLVRRGLVQLVASDAHDLRRRPPGLSEVAELLTSEFDEATSRLLTVENPRAVLSDDLLRAVAGRP